MALGLYDNDNLIYAGKVGTGFDEKTLSELKNKLDEIKTAKIIVESESDVIPVKPILVAQINYLEITKKGKLRAPVFVRLRDDKEAEECTLPR